MSTARILPFSSKLGFGVGQIAEGITGVAFNTFTLFFYNQVIGVSAALTGVALAIAMVFDAISDPLAGSVSDRLNTRWGRRLPLIAVSGPPLALCIVALFNPPSDMPELFYFGWLTFFAVLARLFLTLYHVPHMALGAEMAQDYTDRTRVFAYSQLFSMVGGAGFAFLMYTFFFASTEGRSHGMLNEAGYPPFSLVAAIGIIVSVALCVGGTAKEIPHLPRWHGEEERFTLRRLWRELTTAMRSKSYRVLLIGMLLCILTMGVEATFMVYIYVHFWGLATEAMRWLSPIMIIAIPISIVLVPVITKRFDKRRILVLFAGFTMVNMNIMIFLRLFTDWLPPTGDERLLYLLLCFAFAGGLISPAMMVTFNSMFADIAEELELRTGTRQEGIIFSARSFCFKAGGALATVIGGLALDLIGFPRGAEAGAVPAEIILRLGWIAGPAPTVLGLTSVLFFLGYELDRSRMGEIETALAERRNGVGSEIETALVE